MKNNQTEKDFNRVLKRLRKNNPFWREQEELGKLLMINISDMTIKEKQKRDELMNILIEAKNEKII